MYGLKAVPFIEASFSAACEAVNRVYRVDRLKFSSADNLEGTPEEYKDASLGRNVHFGSYAVDSAYRSSFLSQLGRHRSGSHL
jgi:hypothetical protein